MMLSFLSDTSVCRLTLLFLSLFMRLEWLAEAHLAENVHTRICSSNVGLFPHLVLMSHDPDSEASNYPHCSQDISGQAAATQVSKSKSQSVSSSSFIYILTWSSWCGREDSCRCLSTEFYCATTWILAPFCLQHLVAVGPTPLETN